MMRQPSYALLLFADGATRNALQLAALANVPANKAAADIAALKARGLLAIQEPRPVKNWGYAITREGMAHLRRNEADTKTSRVLAAFLGGEALNSADVESASGVERKRVLNTVRRLELRGWLLGLREGRNVRWTITNAGREAIGQREVEPPALGADEIISTAKRTRTALEMFWGSA